MRLDYCQLLSEVLMATKPQFKPLHPTLTFGEQGFYFNGILYGSDEKAAIKAREDYYSGFDDLRDVL